MIYKLGTSWGSFLGAGRYVIQYKTELSCSSGYVILPSYYYDSWNYHGWAEHI